MSNTDIITETDIAGYYAGSKSIDFFVDKMKAYGGTSPKPSAAPTLIILGGSPGVGKSTAIKKITSYNGIPDDNYLVISLDNIIENYEPYRAATRKVVLEQAGINLTRKNNYTNSNKFKSNFQKITKVIGKLSGAYITHMKPLLEIRDDIFKYAVEKGYNIVYDTTFKKRDIVEDDILPYLTPSYSAIKVIHIYTLDVKTIKNRLSARHQNFLRNPDKNYIRGIHTFLAEGFLKDNDVGFKTLLEKYGANRTFQFCEFENNSLETPFTCGEYVPNKVWIANVKNETPTTPPSSGKALQPPLSPRKHYRERANISNKNLSTEFKKLSLNKTRRQRLLEKLDETLKNNNKKNETKNNKMGNVFVQAPVTGRITRSMTKKIMPK